MFCSGSYSYSRQSLQYLYACIVHPEICNLSQIPFAIRVISLIRALVFSCLCYSELVYQSDWGCYYLWGKQQLLTFSPDLRWNCLWFHFSLTDCHGGIYTNIFMSSYFWVKTDWNNQTCILTFLLSRSREQALLRHNRAERKLTLWGLLYKICNCAPQKRRIG